MCSARYDDYFTSTLVIHLNPMMHIPMKIMLCRFTMPLLVTLWLLIYEYEYILDVNSSLLVYGKIAWR